MTRIVLDQPAMRLEILPTLGAGVGDWSVRSPLGDWTPIFRRSVADEKSPEGLGMFLMGPWTNRVGGAAFVLNGERIALDPNHTDGTAIHGPLRDTPFHVIHRSPVSVVLESELSGHGGWPWPALVRVRYELLESSFSVDLRIRNDAPHAVPMGAGLHPYFRRQLWTPDTAQLKADTLGRFVCEQCLPVGGPVDDTISAALRSGIELQGRHPEQGSQALGEGLDDVFLLGAAEFALTWPHANVSLRVRSTTASHLVVYTPQTPDGPAEWLCVEPTTLVNDAFNLHTAGWQNTGTRIIQPGDSIELLTTFELSR